jgi:hypothetical protein
MLVNEINKCFAAIDRSVAAAGQMRIKVGELLIDAQKRVRSGEYGNIGWQAWCELKIKRSGCDIRKCMKIARADDPMAALEEERKKNADRMARTRRPLTRVSGNPASAPARPRPSLATLAQNRPTLVAPPREESGVPPDEEAMEQDPNSPPGWTRHMAHIRDHGMVQTASPSAIEARNIEHWFENFTLSLRRLIKDEPYTLDDLEKLDSAKRSEIEKKLRRDIPQMQELLARLSLPQKPHQDHSTGLEGAVAQGRA